MAREPQTPDMKLGHEEGAIAFPSVRPLLLSFGRLRF
jgi:hypothetical protein